MKKILIFAVAVLFILAILGERTAAAEALPVPTIVINPDVYYPLDEVLYLEGRTEPKATVEIELRKSGAKPHRFTVKGDPNGEWVLAERVPLGAGDWEVRARTIEGKERASEWSNPRIFKVIATGITIGRVNIKFAALALFIFGLLVAGGGIVLYFVLRVRRLQAALVAKEIREAQESVRTGLADLKHEILDELKLLSFASKKLSSDELARKEHLLRELERVEHDIKREIDDIEKRTYNG